MSIISKAEATTTGRILRGRNGANSDAYDCLVKIRDFWEFLVYRTGLSVEESIRMTQDRDKWRKYVHGVANPRIEEG